MNWRLLLITPLLAGCPITEDNGDSNTDASMNSVTTEMSTNDGTDSSDGSDSSDSSDSSDTSGGGECDYQCNGIACNFTCMGESIWQCTSDSTWQFIEDCGALGKHCEQVGQIYECVDPGGPGDGDGDPGDGGDCATVSTTEPPLTSMGPYGSCDNVSDCPGGFNTCIDNQCSNSCFTDADCPPAPGYAPECVLLDFDSTCFLTCGESSDCPGGLVCCDGRCNWP